MYLLRSHNHRPIHRSDFQIGLRVSEDLKNTLISEFQCDQQKVAVIPNVASKDFYFEKEINNPAKIKAVSFASWDYPKRPDLLFEAASILPNDIKSRLEFHFVGEGPALNIVRESYEKEANNLTIKFHGFQPKKELADICRTSHMMIHPTDAENAPTAAAALTRRRRLRQRWVTTMTMDEWVQGACFLA